MGDLQKTYEISRSVILLRVFTGFTGDLHHYDQLFVIRLERVFESKDW